MEIRITLSVSGDNFDAKNSLERLYSAELKTFFYKDEYPDTISFVHPDEFVDYDEGDYEAYEKLYLDFIIMMKTLQI